MKWLPDMDLNHDKQIQSLLCYRYTIGQTGVIKLERLPVESRRDGGRRVGRVTPCAPLHKIGSPKRRARSDAPYLSRNNSVGERLALASAFSWWQRKTSSPSPRPSPPGEGAVL